MAKMMSFSSACISCVTLLLLTRENQYTSVAFSPPTNPKSLFHRTGSTTNHNAQRPFKVLPPNRIIGSDRDHRHDDSIVRLWSNDSPSADAVVEEEAIVVVVAKSDSNTVTANGDGIVDETASSSLNAVANDASSVLEMKIASTNVNNVDNDNNNNNNDDARSDKPRPSFPLVLWRFTRPHTLIGSAIAIPSIFLLASPTYPSFLTASSLSSLLYAAIPSLLMNLYITGLNQITDIEIDKINKPNLVLANGDLTKSTAIVIVTLAAIISLAMSVIHPIYSTQGLKVALWGSFVLGTMYSMPPIRMKRHPLLAAFCIVAVRGAIVNAGFYSHALSSAFGAATAAATAGTGVVNCLLHDWKCTLSSLFFGIFGIVIALMKDVPDAHGDRIFNIKSFTVRVGQTRVFTTMKNLLTALYLVVGGALMQWAIMAVQTSSGRGVVVRRGLVGVGCWLAGWSTRKEARGVDAEDSGEVYSYYMHLWKLFYLSYLALPFVK